MIKPVTLRQIFVLLVMCILTLVGTAQDNPLQAGDPPLSHLINVAAIDDVTVNVTGEAGAVFASAGVIVQNLYTGATETTIAAGNGSFEIAISGTDRMPYQVNAIRTLPQTMTDPLPGVGTIVYPDYSTLREGQPIPFGIGGQLSYGANVWFGEGRINQLNFNTGDDLILTMNIRLFVPDADPTLPYTMRGQLALRRLFDENGRQLSTAIGAGDDWSSELTPTGLPILGRHIPDTVIAEASTERLFIDEETGELGFRFNFLTTIPNDLPAGLYVPVFTGQASIADSEPFDWYANRVFSTGGDNSSSVSSTVLGLPIHIGEVGNLRLALNILGKLAVEDGSNIAIVNLPTETMDNDPILSKTFAPETLPDYRPIIVGWQDYLPVQTGEVLLRFFMEEDEFAASVNIVIENGQYKVSGIEDILESTYLFLNGNLTDTFGNQYMIGGEYQLLPHKEVISIAPTILPGTPLTANDDISLQTTIFPPENTTTVNTSEYLFETITDKYGTLGANSVSEFNTFSSLAFDAVGEYELHYFGYNTNDDRRGWGGQKYLMGLVSQPSNTANGVMGLADYDRNPQAWFDTRSYPTDAPDVPAFVNFPYFQGDVVFVPDGANSGINPVLTGGDYQYLSIVRPDVTVRQFVRDSHATFDARVSNDDLLGGQIGAGSAGNRPGDVMFLFGGTVAGDDIRGYSALAVVTNEDSARVVPPFTEPLFTIRNEPYYMFVLPTGVRPGQVLEVGNTFAHVGYIAPTVAADVYTEIMTPSGEIIQNQTTASPFGYFYEPAHDFTVTESGVYRVFTQASYNGITSAGQLSRTFIGHPLGAEEYYVFVVPQGEPMLTTPRESISTVTSGQTFTINVRAPEDWTNVNAYFVVRTASTILEQGTLDIFANQTNYNFEWGQISRTFPNIESAATAPSDMDEITFSFAMTGLDANGNPVIRARLFTLRGNTLYTFGS